MRAPQQGWDAQMAEWREVITRIWKEFEDGRADVDPKDNGRPCGQCHLHSLCRVYDLGIHSGDSEQTF